MINIPPRRILVCMDRSLPSLAAWRYAKALARRLGAEVEVLHVQPWVSRAAGLIGNAAETAKRGARMLASLRRTAGPKVPVYSLPGDPVETLVSWPLRRGFDLVVMGTHGRRGLMRTVMGSVAEEVVHRSPVPVLVTRKAVLDLKAVLAPVDFMRRSYAGLDAAGKLALALGARLTLLYVGDPMSLPDRKAVKRAERMLSGLARSLPKPVRRLAKPKTRLLYGPPAPKIVSEARRCGLVVLTAASSRFLDVNVLGTTAEKVIRHSETPVLAVPSPR